MKRLIILATILALLAGAAGAFDWGYRGLLQAEVRKDFRERIQMRLTIQTLSNADPSCVVGYEFILLECDKEQALKLARQLKEAAK